MAVPTWVIAYTVLLLLGLVVGLIFRFVVTLVVVVAVVVVLAIWLLGVLSSAALSGLPTWAGDFVGGWAIGVQLLFTVGGLLFVAGVALGLLLTTRLRGVDRARAA